MFTDNSAVESCAYKGSSTSPKLLSLIVRLREQMVQAMQTEKPAKRRVIKIGQKGDQKSESSGSEL